MGRTSGTGAQQAEDVSNGLAVPSLAPHTLHPRPPSAPSDGVLDSNIGLPGALRTMPPEVDGGIRLMGGRHGDNWVNEDYLLEAPPPPYQQFY